MGVVWGLCVCSINLTLSLFQVYKNKCDSSSTHKWPGSLSDKKQELQSPGAATELAAS